MIVDKKQWPEDIKKVVKDLDTVKYTEGRVCAIASVRHIRDRLLASMRSKEGKQLFPDKIQAEVTTWVKAEFLELIKALGKETEDGFASNASAAAKNAGFKTEAVSTEKVDKLLD